MTPNDRATTKPRGVCAHLDDKPAPDARGRVYMRDRPYSCNHPVPEKPALPECFRFQWPPHKTAVWKDDCAKCPFWTPMETTDDQG